MLCKHKKTRGIGNLQEKPVSNERKLVMWRNLWLSFQLSSVYTLRVGVCSKKLYWKCFINRAANDWSTGFAWQLSLFEFDINRSANDWSTGFVWQLSCFGVDMINQKKILNLTWFFLIQSSGETTSYSGRIDSQSGRNDSGRTGHRAKRPASNAKYNAYSRQTSAKYNVYSSFFKCASPNTR